MAKQGHKSGKFAVGACVINLRAVLSLLTIKQASKMIEYFRVAY